MQLVVFRMQYGPGVRVESQQNRLASYFGCSSFQQVEHSTVPNMHAVEGAYGQYHRDFS